MNYFTNVPISSVQTLAISASLSWYRDSYIHVKRGNVITQPCYDFKGSIQGPPVDSSFSAMPLIQGWKGMDIKNIYSISKQLC